MDRNEMAQIIDLDRYPLDRPETDRYRAMLEDGKAALERSSLYALESFVRSEFIGRMARELEDLRPQAARYDGKRGAYGSIDPALPADHPRNQLHTNRYHQVLNYQIPNDSPLRKIFFWQPLSEFLRQLCGFQTFFRSECPHLALTSKIAGEGDTDGWHYDGNDVVFSLLLQAPEAGGEFEYAPNIRSATDERYDAVASVLDDPARHAVRPGLAVGNLTVFRGDLSLHRVTPVLGARNRIVALFSYDEHPGMAFSQSYIQKLHSGLPGHRNTQ